MSHKKIFVPRLMDADNFNPQNSNAQNMLVRWPDGELRISTFCYNAPRQEVAGKASVNLTKLWRWRLWRLSAWLAYQQRIDAVFYPGADVSDDLGWRFRDWTGRRVPIIATLEGLVGNAERESEYSAWAGHQVYCQHVDKKVLARIDSLYERADHVIAISPFLAKMGKKRYGDKFHVLSLGIERRIFHNDGRTPKDSFSVVGCGRLYGNKRPELFLQLAAQFPDAEFTWYGDGEIRSQLCVEKGKLGLTNVHFPGSVSPVRLAEAFRCSHLFVLPSLSEGAPKVLQEASACGLPVVCFGYYEPPSVADGKNGCVVWNDEELFFHIEHLIGNPQKAKEMGINGSRMAEEWCWDRVAPLWFDTIKGGLNG